jgi:DNA-binding NarL/FixJ family response regulator
MPEMNGIEATRRIMEELVGVKVIALSVHNNPQYKELMRQAGAVAYVSKDRLADELALAIRAVA